MLKESLRWWAIALATNRHNVATVIEADLYCSTLSSSHPPPLRAYTTTAFCSRRLTLGHPGFLEVHDQQVEHTRAFPRSEKHLLDFPYIDL